MIVLNFLKLIQKLSLLIPNMMLPAEIYYWKIVVCSKEKAIRRKLIKGLLPQFKIKRLRSILMTCSGISIQRSFLNTLKTIHGTKSRFQEICLTLCLDMTIYKWLNSPKTSALKTTPRQWTKKMINALK